MPEGVEAVPPAGNARLRGAPMLDEQQASAGLEHASHLAECRADLGNAAAGPCHHDRIHTAVGQRNRFSRALEEMDGTLRMRNVGPRPRQQSRRWIEPKDV